jgi:hypothetical protein
MRQPIALVVLGLLALTLPATAGPPPTPEILYDLFSDDLSLTTPLTVHVLDPTGQWVAWLERGDTLKVFDVRTADVRAIPLPEFLKPVTEFEWSPDGMRVVMTENVFLYLYEPDVWIVDLTAPSVANCTNDLVFGSVLDSEERVVDFLPTWRSAESIAFIRPSGEDLHGPAEMRTTHVTSCGSIDQSSSPDASQTLWPLPEEFPSAFQIFRSPAWSPDGTRVAIITQDLTFSGTTNGIWILNAQTGAVERFVPTAVFDVGFPEWFDASRIVPQDLAWMDDGAHLLVFVEDPIGSLPRMNLFLIDTATGSVEPIADYHRYETKLAFFESDTTDTTGTIEVPLQAVVLPEAAGFLTLHQEADPRHEDASRIELRRYIIEDGHAVLDGSTAFVAEPQARGRGPNIVRVSEQGVALLLNRYLVAFDMDLLSDDATGN